MKINIVIFSEELTKEDIRLLLQSIRDFEQTSLPHREIGVAVFIPELSTDECREVVKDIKPPFKHGPFVLGGKRDGN